MLLFDKIFDRVISTKRNAALFSVLLATSVVISISNLDEMRGTQLDQFATTHSTIAIIGLISLLIYTYRSLKIKAYSNTYVGAIFLYAIISVAFNYYATETAASQQDRALKYAECLRIAGDNATAGGQCYSAFNYQYPLFLAISFCATGTIAFLISLWAHWKLRSHASLNNAE